MAIDISGISYFLPIFGFLFVFVIVYALLAKTKLLGDSQLINLIISFIVAIIFSTMASVEEYIETVTPWFVVLVIVLFFILIIIGLSQQKISDIMKPGFVWVFIIALIVIFLISAVKVFSFWQPIKEFVTTEARIAGAVILLAIAALTAWVLTKK
ncbi:MAG: hypothetical protein AABX71_03195 [Nanoarchaeota archaeon]